MKVGIYCFSQSLRADRGFIATLAAAVAPPPAAAPSAAIAQAQQRYQDATLRQSRNIHIVEGPSALGRDQRFIREEICTRVVRKGKRAKRSQERKST